METIQENYGQLSMKC